MNADVSGGENVAIGGRDARVTHHHAPSAQSEELRELIKVLRQEIDAHAHEVDDPGALRESADSLEEEILEKEQPRRGTIEMMLSGMTSAAGQVSTVAGAIENIRRAVGLMF